MEQAHGGGFVIRWAGLQNGADQHLQQPATQRVHHHCQQNTHKRIGSTIRQNRQQDQTGSGKAVGQQNRRPVANPVNEPGRQQIYTQLDEKIHSDQQGNLLQRHPVVGLEGDKQQGHKVVYNGLHNIADKAGIHGLLIGLFHLFSPW